ncbi:hypothetical protein B566_EDAN003649 [Ephemera danica]|nr:hypothetical protein B566_EDAN003649 [Ephemera danica]
MCVIKIIEFTGIYYTNIMLLFFHAVITNSQIYLFSFFVNMIIVFFFFFFLHIFPSHTFDAEYHVQRIKYQSTMGIAKLYLMLCLCSLYVQRNYSQGSECPNQTPSDKENFMKLQKYYCISQCLGGFGGEVDFCRSDGICPTS